MIQSRHVAVRYTLGVAACVAGLAGATALHAVAQARSPAEGVYSATQAMRGQQIYQSQCVSCHGDALEGANLGPPLVGDFFTSNWSGRSLAELVDQIQKTMPFDAPESLSREESIDLAAYILEAGSFPAGDAELSDAALAEVAFPEGQATASTPAAAGPVGPSLAPPEGNMAELMRAIAFPNANIIFNVQLHDPSTATRGPARSGSFDYVEWGTGVYAGWISIDQAALALIEAAPLLLTPGRRCQNGRPVPVDSPDWREYTEGMMEVGRVALRASRERDRDALIELSEELSNSCNNCHRVYRGRTRCEAQ